jgi:hypothetical protein
LSITILVFTFKCLEAFLYDILFSERSFHTKPTPTSSGTRIFVVVLDYSRILVPLLATVQLQRNLDELQVCDAQKMNGTETKMIL